MQMEAKARSDNFILFAFNDGNLTPRKSARDSYDPVEIKGFLQDSFRK